MALSEKKRSLSLLQRILTANTGQEKTGEAATDLARPYVLRDHSPRGRDR